MSDRRSTQATHLPPALPFVGSSRQERAALLTDGSVLTQADLRFDTDAPSRAPQATDTRLTLVELEQRHIAAVLREEQGHVERAAFRLGIPRSSLYEKVKRYGIVVKS